MHRMALGAAGRYDGCKTIITQGAVRMNGTETAGGRPRLSFWSIWNMCFGFLGLQFGWALQNANASRIFQTLGADLDQIPILWVAAPLTGLLIQPIVGYMSDRTWGRLGRRRPYFLAGAILSSMALIAMPRSPYLWIAAGMLWILDGSINVAMQPFRAFIGDQLPPTQRASGYAMQSFFIGIGSVVASILPWLLARYGVANVAEGHNVPDTVRIAFDLGSVVLLVAVLWTVIFSREYPPERLDGFADDAPPLPAEKNDPARRALQGCLWSAAGAAAVASIWHWKLDPQLYLLSSGVFLWGLMLIVYRKGGGKGFLAVAMSKLSTMPQTMRELVPVQFFSWVALFAMWIYATPAVAQTFFGATDPHSAAYNQGANWVGVLFAAYNGFAALAAMVIPVMVRLFGIKVSHLINLVLGAAGFLSFLAVKDANWLLLSMAGVGFAWASILSLPYALLSDSVPSDQMGLYMGVFNLFVVIPQLVAASVLGFFITRLFGGQPIYALVLGGASFLIAGILVLRVKLAKA
jgi:maltose/moltooligosaccharide transporter